MRTGKERSIDSSTDVEIDNASAGKKMQLYFTV